MKRKQYVNIGNHANDRDITPPLFVHLPMAHAKRTQQPFILNFQKNVYCFIARWIERKRMLWIPFGSYQLLFTFCRSGKCIRTTHTIYEIRKFHLHSLCSAHFRKCCAWPSQQAIEYSFMLNISVIFLLFSVMSVKIPCRLFASCTQGHSGAFGPELNGLQCVAVVCAKRLMAYWDSNLCNVDRGRKKKISTHLNEIYFSFILALRHDFWYVPGYHCVCGMWH